MGEGDLVFWNRAGRRYDAELMYGESLMRWLYETWPGRFLEERFFSKPAFSRLYGGYQDTRLSALKIPGFIRKFGIPMEEFESVPYRSFNEFFIRRFKPGARRFAPNPAELPAFAEGRYLAFEKVGEDQAFPVKGRDLTAEAILGDAERARPFLGGAVLIARLCPTDYHRFHFPDDGTVHAAYRVPGHLHSVNPLSLKRRSDIFAVNERTVAVLDTRGFGKLAYVEVGALCVGKIVQTHSGEKAFRRGDEKGYFLFGGSTVIVLGEPGRWKPDADLLEQTRARRETFVRLGERIGARG